MNRAPSRTSAFSAVLHALFYVFVYLFFQYMVTVAYMASLMLRNGTALTFDEASMLALVDQVNAQTVMILLISNLLTILTVCLFQTVRMRRPAEEFRLRPMNLMRIPTCLLFGSALNLFVSGILSFLPLPEELIRSFENLYASLDGTSPLWLEILSVGVVAGITEEIIFRGFVTTRLSRGMRMGSVVLVSSILFGLVHGTPIAFGYSVLLGIVFSLMCEKFRSVLPTILVHFSFNTTSCVLGGLDGRWMLPVWLFSAAAVLFCTYRLFLRRPTFYDVAADMVGEYELRDNTEREIIAEIRRMQEDGDISPEKIEQLAEAWEENERKYNVKSSGNDNPDNDNNTKET